MVQLSPLITHSLSVSEQAEHAFLICHGKIIDKGNINKINQYFKDECQLCIDKETRNKRRINTMNKEDQIINSSNLDPHDVKA